MVTASIAVTREAPIATIQLNRPEVLNALDTMDRLVRVRYDPERDDSIRTIIVTRDDITFGAGGTHCPTRTVGKSRAMESILTGRTITADGALQRGLIAKVPRIELYVSEAKSLARGIAAKSPVAIRLTEEAVFKAFETGFHEGLEFERKNFHLLFASKDQQE